MPDSDNSLAQSQASTALVVRSQVALRSNYLEYKDDLRHDFCYACAYCALSEVESSGVGFQIDHYVPIAHDQSRRHDYDNLMWSCQQCNRYKSSYYHTPKDEAEGRYVLRPDREDPRPHFDVKDVLWKGRTPTGEFNLDRLELNRDTLVVIRDLRARLATAQDFIAWGVREVFATSIDIVKDEYRSVLLVWQARVALAENQAKQNIQDLIRSSVRSPLLDTPAASPARLEHLASLGVIAPNVARTPQPPQPRRRRRRRRR